MILFLNQSNLITLCFLKILLANWSLLTLVYLFFIIYQTYLKATSLPLGHIVWRFLLSKSKSSDGPFLTEARVLQLFHNCVSAIDILPAFYGSLFNILPVSACYFVAKPVSLILGFVTIPPDF